MIVDAVTTNLAAPIAIDDFYTIPVNTAKKIEPLTYGASDSDPNGESLTLAYINGEEVYGDNQIIEVPNGKLQVNNVNDITFIPNKQPKCMFEESMHTKASSCFIKASS